MENKQRLALIDLDTIMFIIAYRQFKDGNRDNPELVRIHVRDFISTILVRCRADLYSMVYQAKGHSNFRKYFYPDYKSNRPSTPEFIDVWRDTILEEFESLGAIGVKVIESDDVLNIGYHRLKDKYELIIVSGDKDLDQIPGEHYNPRENRSYDLSNEQAVFKLYTQILMGDNTDNIQGIPKVGIKKAEDLLLLGSPEYTGYRHVCYKAYQKSFGNLWYSFYLKTRFLVGLLAEIDYNSYPTNQEVPELFNIKKVSDFVVSNVFN
jgi:5'-3' exonuclease